MATTRILRDGQEQCKARLKAGFAAAGGLSAHDTRLLCRLLRVDFVCFGFAPPPECEGVDWES